jgi:hypothetical protein
VPASYKQGQLWYTVAQVLVLCFFIVSYLCLFWGNTHTTLLRFLYRKKIFAQVVCLSVLDFVQRMAAPEPGWEATDRIQAITALVSRLAFFCTDSVQGVSAWFRLLTAVNFTIANLLLITQACLLNTPVPMYFINATNTTITNTQVQVSVCSSMVTLTLQMIVTIWKDPDFQFCALYRSYLPKLAVETAGIEPVSDEMDHIIEKRNAGTVAWRGWPRTRPTMAVLGSVLVFLALIAPGTTSRFESLLLITLRLISLALGLAGASALLFNNLNWALFKFTFTSVKGTLTLSTC